MAAIYKYTERKIRELAEKDSIIHACMMAFGHEKVTWEQALIAMAVHLHEQNVNLTRQLIECRQAAFENGRETERAAGYGELEY